MLKWNIVIIIIGDNVFLASGALENLLMLVYIMIC